MIGMNCRGSPTEALFTVLCHSVFGAPGSVLILYYNLILGHQECFLEAESKGPFLNGV